MRWVWLTIVLGLFGIGLMYAAVNVGKGGPLLGFFSGMILTYSMFAHDIAKGWRNR